MATNIPEKTPITVTHPDLVKEWNYEKNPSLTPNDVSKGSNKLVWWKCNQGHEWKASVDKRVAGRKCPFCAGRKIIVGFNDLGTINPELAKEWHPTKNGALTPRDVTAGSSRKVWWLGKCGHEWEATIYNRNKNGTGCLICGYKKTGDAIRKIRLQASGSLFSNMPDIAQEWHPTKNGTLTPKDVTARSNRKVWWLGKCGHEWEASVDKRTAGRNCPFCAGKRVLEGLNDLNLCDVELAQEWHPTKNAPLTPNDVTAGSSKKVWWLGKCGHEWEAPINKRVSGQKCPFCSGKHVIQTNNSLSMVNPELVQEWHPTKNDPLLPTEVAAKSNLKVWWLGKCGHEWIANVSSRSNGIGCPICTGKIVLPGFNDLASKYPVIAKEWHPTKNGTLLPSEVTSKSSKKVWWMCPKGHEWETTVGRRTMQGSGCIYCALEKQTSFPEQALFFYFSKITTTINRYNEENKEIDIYLPELKTGIEYDGMRYHNSEQSKNREKQKDDFFLRKGVKIYRVKESKENSINNNIVYYKYSAGYKNLPWAIDTLMDMIGFKNVQISIDIDRDRSDIYELYIQREKENSLATKYPNLLQDWDFENNRVPPTMISAASNKKVWWRCSLGHVWIAQVNSRIRGSGCPVCAGIKAQKGFNDIQTRNPELAKEWHPTKNGNLTACDVAVGSSKEYWWICNQGHEWRTSPHLRKKGHGCPICGKHKAANSRNRYTIMKNGSLNDVNPELAKEWDFTKNGELTPDDVSKGSHKIVWWIGKCGHEWMSTVRDRCNGVGCPYCAGKKVFPGFNDLLSRNPLLANEWHPSYNSELTPRDVTVGSKRKVWWIGKCGHEWEAAISDRNQGQNCPFCAGKRVLVGFNDLETVKPDLAKEWHPSKNGELTPKQVTFGSGKKVWWKGTCGHEWEATINSRAVNGCKCPVCNSIIRK